MAMMVCSQREGASTVRRDPGRYFSVPDPVIRLPSPSNVRNMARAHARSCTFSPVVPLPRRWARAKNWAQHSRAGRLDAPALSVMRELEWANRG